MDIISNREKQMKLITILRYAMMGGVILVFLSWLLPFFRYPEADYGLDKGYKATKSLWGIMLYPTNFLQIEKVMDVKFISLRHLHVIVIGAVAGIIAIITCANKRGIATCLFPLFFSVYGLVGYFVVPLMNQYCCYPAFRAIQIVLLALTFIVSLASFVLGVIELKTRPAEGFLAAMGE